MKKITSLFLIITILFSFFGNSFVYALDIEQTNEIIYPEGEKFDKLESIVEKYLVKSKYTYRGKYKGNIMYNDIIEKEIKAIIIETYEGNQDFYNNFFYDNRSGEVTIKKVLDYVPKVSLNYNIRDILFNNYTAGDRLMNASFGIDYNPGFNNDSLIYSVKRIIDNYKRVNGKLPSLNELKKETIFLNGENVLIETTISELDYKLIEKGILEGQSILINAVIDSINLDASKNLDSVFASNIKQDLDYIKNSKPRARLILNGYKKYLDNSKVTDNNYNDKKRIINDILSFIKDMYFSETSYTLKRKDINYTYEEALEKNKIIEDKNNSVKKVNYKDYKTLIGDSEVKNIPEIYKKIPNDSIFLHTKNPQFIFDLVNRNNSLLDSTTGVGILKKLKSLTKDWFDIENFDHLEQNLKHEFLIVISDLDLTNPDITIIINKEDKNILVPTDEPKTAITKGDYIYITNSKKSLDKFDNLEEQNSIYNSLDFRYLWLQKGEKFKDIFFYAGDKFFEKMISFDYFIKMNRKIDDYIDLHDLQTYVLAYKKLYNKDISFGDLDNFFEVSGINKDKILKEFKVSSNSIVEHNSIGTLDSLKGIIETDYDLSTITGEELRSYQQSILKYKEIWRDNLDPMGIFINDIDDGFSIDFFMTPLPALADGELSLLKSFFGLGVEEFDLLKNENLRIGTIGGMLGIDMQEVKNRLNNIDNEANRDLYYLKRGLDELNEELLNGGNILEYLGGEFIFSLGGVDSSIFNSWNPDKLDAFLAIEFTSSIKAKELVNKIRKKVSSELGNSLGIDDKLKAAIIKPISENYNGKTIYQIPINDSYFRINIYYTIIDSFLYITVGDLAIKKVIDFSKNNSNDKEKFLDKGLDNKEMFFGFLDADKFSKVVNDLNFGSGSTIEDIYVEMISSNDLDNINPIKLDLSKYYKDTEYAKLLGKKIKDYNYNMGFLNVFSKEKELYITINKDLINTSNLEVNEEINLIFSGISENYFTDEGGKLSELLSKEDLFNKLMRLDLFSKAMDSEFITKLLLNTSLSLNVGDNIIEFKFSAFGNNYSDKIKSNDNPISSIGNVLTKELGSENSKYILLFVMIFMIIIGLGLVVIMKKKKDKNNIT